MEIASFMKDTARIYTSRLRLATLYAFSGMYRESESLLRSIDRELLSKEQKQDFYEAYYSFSLITVRIWILLNIGNNLIYTRIRYCLS